MTAARTISCCLFVASLGLVLGLAAEDSPIFDGDVKTENFAPLDYPRFAQALMVEGMVAIRVSVGENGRVVSADAISGPKALIPDSLANSRKWTFRPNSAKHVVIFYHFKIDRSGLCWRPCSSQVLYTPPNLLTITTGTPIATQ